MIDLKIFSNRRASFLSQLGARAAVIPAAATVIHHADCEFSFRQNSDFWYLTGFDEPDAIALFLPHRNVGEQFVLFVNPKDSLKEVWEGLCWGTEGAVDRFGADIAHPLDEFPQRLSGYLQGAESIAFRVGKYPKVEPIVLGILSEQVGESFRSGVSPLKLEAPCPILHQMRLVKCPDELQSMRKAAKISAEAHELARTSSRPGLKERFIQALMEEHFLKEGARGPAYGSIVAAGDNACVLHYTANNDFLKDGDLLLIDAGCSMDDYYNADITRTFPVNGTFSAEQLALYEIVLAAQIEAISTVSPGNNAEDVHAKAVYCLVEGLIELGLLKGSVDGVIEQGAYKHLYMHRTGHWLGLDVHDVGAYRLGEYPVPLKQGMVLTVEPGLYISDRLPVPDGQPQIEDRWKGIGIRIEDDVAVTESGNEVLSALAAKSVDAMQN